jgi:hypothetical protein
VQTGERMGVGPGRNATSRPIRRPGFVASPVAGELVLLSPGGETAHALNESAADVWRLCDGSHTPLDMLEVLRGRYAGDLVEILADVTAALLRFHDLSLIDLNPGDGHAMAVASDASASARGPRVRFVFGLEDLPYFHWQMGILLESLVGKVEAEWDITLVVCNDHEPLSAELVRLIDVYGVAALTGDNHAHSHKVDFSTHEGGYVALNRVEALKVIAPHVASDDVVCLMDTDLFLYGELRLDAFPRGNAMAANAIVSDPRFLGGGSEERGIDLQKLLAAIGCERELKRGAVTVFLTGATLRNDKVIKDCFRFAQIIYLLGKTAGLPDTAVWMSEMACFAMSLTANDIDYELLDAPQFAVPDPEPAVVATGSFFHYYADINDGRGGPFLGSEWNKQLFPDRDFLGENLESFRKGARTDIERSFFDLSLAARKRLRESPRP